MHELQSSVLQWADGDQSDEELSATVAYDVRVPIKTQTLRWSDVNWRDRTGSTALLYSLMDPTTSRRADRTVKEYQQHKRDFLRPVQGELGQLKVRTDSHGPADAHQKCSVGHGAASTQTLTAMFCCLSTFFCIHRLPSCSLSVAQTSAPPTTAV